MVASSSEMVSWCQSAVAAQGSDTEVEPHNLIAWMLSGKEGWQRYSKMLRGIMRKREEREKSRNYRGSTRSNTSRFRADAEDEEVILVRANRTYTAEWQKSVRDFFLLEIISVGYGVAWKWSINKIQCSMTHSQIPSQDGEELAL